MKHLDVIPAYGRDYTSAIAALADWEGDRDFRVVSFNEKGGYVNRAQAHQLKREGYTHVCIRYHRLTKVAHVRL